MGAFIGSALLILLCGVTGIFERLRDAHSCGVGPRPCWPVCWPNLAWMPLALLPVAPPSCCPCWQLISWASPPPPLCGAVDVGCGHRCGCPARPTALGASAVDAGHAAMDSAGLHVAGLCQPGPAAVRGHHGFAKSAWGHCYALGRLCRAGVGHRQPDTGSAQCCAGPFGGYAINFAAITAALCTGTEAHPNPARRYTAAVVCSMTCLFATGVVCRCGHRLAVGFSKRIGDSHRRVCLAGQYCRWLARCLGRCPAAGSSPS